jgi:hypothetical protein
VLASTAVDCLSHWYLQTFLVRVFKEKAADQINIINFTNKTDRHDIAEILLKVALNTIKQTNKIYQHLL